MILKYIIVRDNHGSHGRDDGPELAIMFDKNLIHRDVARCHKVGGLVVVSAGFVDIKGYNVRTYGVSVSLGMHSRPEDQAIVGAAVLGDNYTEFDKTWKCIDRLNEVIKPLEAIVEYNSKLTPEVQEHFDNNEKKYIASLVPVRGFLQSLLPDPEPSKQG